MQHVLKPTVSTDPSPNHRMSYSCQFPLSCGTFLLTLVLSPLLDLVNPEKTLCLFSHTKNYEIQVVSLSLMCISWYRLHANKDLESLGLLHLASCPKFRITTSSYWAFQACSLSLVLSLHHEHLKSSSGLGWSFTRENSSAIYGH